MLKIVCSAALCLALANQTVCAESRPLFNGNNFQGWSTYVANHEVPTAEAWTISDGVLRATGKGRGYLVSQRAYADYVLQLEWRWPDGATPKKANSGVLIHLVGPDKLWPKSFEAQLKDGKAGDFASFEDARSDNEIVSRNPNGVSTGRLPRQVPSAEKPFGEWNTYTITARGGEIVLEINGTEVNRMTSVQPSAGHIALQSEGHAIEFRNITLESLPPAKDLHAPMPK